MLCFSPHFHQHVSAETAFIHNEDTNLGIHLEYPKLETEQSFPQPGASYRTILQGGYIQMKKLHSFSSYYRLLEVKAQSFNQVPYCCVTDTFTFSTQKSPSACPHMYLIPCHTL